MIAFVDVDYRENEAVAACVLATDWTDAAPAAEMVEHISVVATYEPGQFWKRELPCLLAVLGNVPAPPSVIVVDGYVWLGDGAPGLGAHLYEALGQRIPVIGVAKTRYESAVEAHDVLRGSSKRALFVSAAGIDLNLAARHIVSMHGTFRLPTLLKEVDRACKRG